MRERRPTSQDVARAAGVSRGTVSHTLNGDPKGLVAPATRERVLDAARRLGYQPSAAARLLRGGRSHTVLLLSPHEEGYDPVMASVLEQLAHALALHRLSLVWQLAIPGIRPPVGEVTPAVVLSSAPLDDHTSILTSGFTAPVLEAFPARDAFIAAPATAQATYLRAKQMTRVVYVAPSAPPLQQFSDLRWEALRAGLGSPRVERTIWPNTREERAAHLELLLEGRSGRVGLAAYNDGLALSILLAAHDVGTRVPEDLSVIGVDNIPAAATSHPPLTTTELPLDDWITRAAEQIARVADRSDPKATLPPLPTDARVVVRETA